MRTAILMCTYNGEKYLAGQLDSIRAQTAGGWKFYAADDASEDATMDILREYQGLWGAEIFHIFQNPGRLGYCRNFLNLTARAEIKADFYFWADQDDVWLPNKIARGLSFLKDAREPALCGGRAILTDAAGRPFGLSEARDRRPPAFANALLQSLAGGNTMAFNQKARELIALGAPFCPACHDWWAYLVVSGAGGKLIYDAEPAIHYRQHGKNQIGDNQGPAARLKRLKRLLWDREYRGWTGRNLLAIKAARKRLTPENQKLLESFMEMRNSKNPIRRLKLFQTSGLYRQDAPGHWAMLLAAILGRI